MGDAVRCRRACHRCVGGAVVTGGVWFLIGVPIGALVSAFGVEVGRRGRR